MVEFVDKILVEHRPEAVRHLQEAIAGGKHWYVALLEAVGIWTETEELYEGRHYRYLIAGEAFDWLLLAERLCEEVDGLVPDEEKQALIFHGKAPLDISKDEFRRLIGAKKYHQHLNYFYGVTVEEAVTLAVHEEVRKERWAAGLVRERDITNEVFRRIYGETRAELLRSFRKEKGYLQVRHINLSELNEFTYWLFKYRLEHCDKTKVASDTRKGLTRLRRLGVWNPAGI